MTIRIRPGGRLGNQLFQAAAAAALRRNNEPIEWEAQTPHPEVEFALLKSVHPNEGYSTVQTWRSTLTSRAAQNAVARALYAICVRAERLTCKPWPAGAHKKRVLVTDRTLADVANTQVSAQVMEVEAWAQSDWIVELGRERGLAMPDLSHERLPRQIEALDYLVLQVRRTDAMAGARTHGVLSPHYYRKALDLLNAATGLQLPTVIVGDDESAIDEVGRSIGQQWLPIPRRGGVLADLNIMARARGVALANSTFGWWGARMCEGLGGKVVSPSPWTRNDPSIDSAIQRITWTKCEAEWL